MGKDEMGNGIESSEKKGMTGRDEIDALKVLETYILARNTWKMRKELAKILDAKGKVLFHLQKGKWMDDAGTMKAEIKDVSKTAGHIHVLDPFGQLLGSVLCTQARIVSNVPQWRHMGRYSLMDPLGQVIGFAEPSDQERVIPAYAIFTPDGRVLASVHKAQSDAHYQLDILLPGLHPLVVLSYVWFYGDAMSYEVIRSGKPKMR